MAVFFDMRGLDVQTHPTFLPGSCCTRLGILRRFGLVIVSQPISLYGEFSVDCEFDRANCCKCTFHKVGD